MTNPKGHYFHRHSATAMTRIQDPNTIGSLRVPLQNLSDLRTRMDSLQRFISESINTHTLLSKNHMDTVSNEIVSAIHHIIINAAALVSYSQSFTAVGASFFPVSGDIPDPPETVPPPPKKKGSLKAEVQDEDGCEIVELDVMELLEEQHVHFCEVCGKAFKRDANLRMHMRAHGDRFRTKEALAKPRDDGTRRARGATRFSCPFEGCSRNKVHEKFRPLKSVSCAKNHFKRSHCPKTYSCDRCRKKCFSVLSDLKSHVKHCGESSKWKCSCGTTFSRKEKLFGHLALFEGHLPEEKGKQVMVAVEEDRALMKESDQLDGLPEGFFDDLDDFAKVLL